jgi:phage/plasmid-associated DNA primase
LTSGHTPAKDENFKNEPIYVQLVHYIYLLGNLRIMKDTGEERPKVLQFYDRRWRFLSEQELSMYCKNFLRKFFNHTTLDMAKDRVEIDLDPLSISVTVRISRDIIKRASNNGFTLKREIKELADEIYDTKVMYHPESYFLPPKNILPFKNGYLDFETGVFSPYGAHGYKGFLYHLGFNYLNGNTDIELPEEFVNLIGDAVSNQKYLPWENNDRCKSFLQCIAYSFIPTNFLRKLFVVVGPTACGKSVFVGIMRAIFGDLGTHLQSYAIMKNHRYDHELRPDLESAIDKLWVDISETEERQTIDTVTIKSYTGNDPITFRKMHSSTRTTKIMNCKIWIMTNRFPKIVNYNDLALEDRLVIFDWYNTIPQEYRDTALKDRLTTDNNRDRIGTYFANKAKDLYHRKNLRIDESFSFNKSKYFQYQDDPIALFYDTLPKSGIDCKPDAFTWIKTIDLARLYETFLWEFRGNNRRLAEDEKRAFENRFSEISSSDHFHFVKRYRKDSIHGYSGILVSELLLQHPQLQQIIGGGYYSQIAP